MDIAAKWAEDRQMTWNTKPGKSEVVEAVENKKLNITLAGQPLGKAEEVEYLGVSMNASESRSESCLTEFEKPR